jgi:hypothetical protein
MTIKQHAADIEDLRRIEIADHFTAFVQIAPGNRVNTKCETLDEAIEVATDMARTTALGSIVYAITKEGRSALYATFRQTQNGEIKMTETTSHTGTHKPTAKAVEPTEAQMAKIAETMAPKVARPAKAAAKAPAAAKAASVPKAPKAAKPAREPKAAKPLSPRAQIEADAAKGKLPKAPDFTAETHKRFRPLLAEVEALVKAKDIAGLKAVKIDPASSSRRAVDRYRNLAVIALEAKATKAAPQDAAIAETI